MIVYVDIDGIICTNTYGDYETAEVTPYHQKWIDKVNKLYNDGVVIVIWTARGTLLSEKIEEIKKLTIKQLKMWGVNYHTLKFGKPYYDRIIDDRSINRLEEL